MIEIFSPRWKDRSVLVADWKITEETKINITCRDVNGDRRYPNPFTVSKEWMQQWPVEQKPFGKMRIVPLDKLLGIA